MNVLVTGAGGPAGVSVIRALRAAGHQSVGADADDMASGLRLAGQSGTVPFAGDPGFVDCLCDLALRTGANALVSTVSEEIGPLSSAFDALERVGLAHWLPSVAAVTACTDKWRFASVCRTAGFPTPATALGGPHDVPGPWVVKPRFGRGSRDVYRVDGLEDAGWASRRVPDALWQTRLTGREFTVDALVGRDGELAGAVPRWRLEVKAGISTKGRTFRDRSLVARVGELLSLIGLQGPANVQGFMTDDEGPVFIEVNPRFSGGLPLSLAAGADLVGEYVQGVLGRPLSCDRLTYRPGVTMSRYLQEVFEG